MADLLMEANNGNVLPPTFSMNNANFYLPGNLSNPITVDGRYGPQLMPYLDEQSARSNANRSNTMQRILELPTDHAMQKFAAGVFKSSRDSARLLSAAIGSSPDFGPVNFQNELDVQLRMVARMISAREQLDMRRQIYFVGLGGWDTHNTQSPRLVNLLTKLNDALGNFNQALITMGVENEVTTFTASEFGRTLTINGDGSDHGWGGHYMVMGGAVNGGRLYGEWPDYRIGGVDDVRGGRIVPKMSMNQYGAALGSWMGLWLFS